MIAQLEGIVVCKGGNFIILDVSGVGYKVHVSLDTLRTVREGKTPLRLWTHLAVRENSLDLYGFRHAPELDFFEMLITISGIGPKSALGILSVASLDALKNAVASGDTSYLTKVSGIGKKNAEKIVVELRDKLGGSEHPETQTLLKEEAETLEALQSLGYTQKQSREALRRVSGTAGTGEKVKEALKHLSEQHHA